MNFGNTPDVQSHMTIIRQFASPPHLSFSLARLRFLGLSQPVSVRHDHFPSSSVINTLFGSAT